MRLTGDKSSRRSRARTIQISIDGTQALLPLFGGRLDEKIADACRKQSFIKYAAVVFVWTTIPYRMEWRYGPIAHKAIAMDAGHLCQNLYLASEAIGAGTCAIGAYTQDKIDAILGGDANEEFAIYVAPVGKIK